MSKANPTPWRMDGETIRDADGHVVISALNPCGMATRRRIVEAVNQHDDLKMKLANAMEIADAFHKELQHVLDCLCYAKQKEANDLSLADEVRPNREAQGGVHSKATESSAGMGGVEYCQTMQIGAERSGGGRAEAKPETSRAAVAPNRAESLNRRNA